jgi:hypothetical protein
LMSALTAILRFRMRVLIINGHKKKLTRIRFPLGEIFLNQCFDKPVRRDDEKPAHKYGPTAQKPADVATIPIHYPKTPRR